MKINSRAICSLSLALAVGLSANTALSEEKEHRSESSSETSSYVATFAAGWVGGVFGQPVVNKVCFGVVGLVVATVDAGCRVVIGIKDGVCTVVSGTYHFGCGVVIGAIDGVQQRYRNGRESVSSGWYNFRGVRRVQDVFPLNNGNVRLPLAYAAGKSTDQTLLVYEN